MVATWNENASLCLNAGPPLSPRQGSPITVNSTVNTSPFFPDGKSPGARCTAPTDESGKVLALNRAASSASPSYQRQIVFFAGFTMSLSFCDEWPTAGVNDALGVEGHWRGGHVRVNSRRNTHTILALRYCASHRRDNACLSGRRHHAWRFDTALEGGPLGPVCYAAVH